PFVGRQTELAAQERRYEAQQAFRLLGRLWILEGVFYDVYAGRGIGGEHSDLGAPGSQTLKEGGEEPPSIRPLDRSMHDAQDCTPPFPCGFCGPSRALSRPT